MIIDSLQSLEEATLHFGLLPFFNNPIKGFSVEEMCAPGLLFGGNNDEGCWEWKGPVIRRRSTAYGKFFRKKAGFVSLELLPDFLNYRRKAYPVVPDSSEEMLLDIIRVNDGMTSTELKAAIFGPMSKRREWNELPDNNPEPFIQTRAKRKSLEGPLQKLQMGGWLIISDFEYKYTKRGERYGWGVARYSTPELTFNNNFNENKFSPEESLERLVKALKQRWPGACRKQALELLK